METQGRNGKPAQNFSGKRKGGKDHLGVRRADVWTILRCLKIVSLE
jgi:hypothetical protein